MKNSELESLNTEEAFDYDAGIDSVLGEFPDDLQNRYEEELEGKLSSYTVREQYQYLRNKLDARKGIIKPERPIEDPSLIEVTEVMPLAIAASLERSNANRSETYLGKGQTAEVLSSVRQEGICYKAFYEESTQVGQNSLGVEVDLQIMAHDLLHDENSVRIPKVYGFHRIEGIEAIMMEEVDGFSLHQFMLGQATLPADFDMQSFEATMKDFVVKMEEAGMYHRDLSQANIMLDKDMNPWVIDFGRSRKSHPNDPDAYLEKTFGVDNPDFRFPQDQTHLLSVLNMFKKYINTGEYEY